MTNLLQRLAKSGAALAGWRVAAALRGVIRLPEDFDERKFKSERLASRFGVLSLARFAGRWTAEEAVAFNELTQRTVDEEDWK